jgi:hypothetical protein
MLSLLCFRFRHWGVSYTRPRTRLGTGGIQLTLAAEWNEGEGMKTRLVFVVAACLAGVQPVWCGHTLNPQQQKVLQQWLGQHRAYRLATDADCQCSRAIEDMKADSPTERQELADFHPYLVTGDFNHDGAEDFAVAVIDGSKETDNFVVLVFNGPFTQKPQSSSVRPFVASGLNLKGEALFYGPPASKPYRLLIGPFESDYVTHIVPEGNSYRFEASDY